MREAISILSLLKKQLTLIIFVRIKFQVIFISNLVEYGSNRIKECYIKGQKDCFSTSKYIWPSAQPNKSVIRAWIQFISMISN